MHLLIKLRQISKRGCTDANRRHRLCVRRNFRVVCVVVVVVGAGSHSQFVCSLNSLNVNFAEAYNSAITTDTFVRRCCTEWRSHLTLGV